MFTASLINHSIPRLQLQDSVGKALRLINDYRVTHLAVIAEEKFLGIISEEDLLDVRNEKYSIEVLEKYFIKAAVLDTVHFLEAVNNCVRHDTNVVPVVNAENDFMGVISTRDLLKALANFAGADEIGGLVILEMEQSQFAISEISRIVESNDCHIMHMNTTVDAASGMFRVTLHLSKREIAAVVATFERYDYDVVYFFGEQRFENEINHNYDNLMRYLNL